MKGVRGRQERIHLTQSSFFFHVFFMEGFVDGGWQTQRDGEEEKLWDESATNFCDQSETPPTQVERRGEGRRMGGNLPESNTRSSVVEFRIGSSKRQTSAATEKGLEICGRRCCGELLIDTSITALWVDRGGSWAPRHDFSNPHSSPPLGSALIEILVDSLALVLRTRIPLTLRKKGNV